MSVTVKGGVASKQLITAIEAASTPASTDITDATTAGKAVLTAASAAAARTAIGAGVPAVSTPASAAATGTAGSWAFDATHIYVCIATNTWVRATLATW